MIFMKNEECDKTKSYFPMLVVFWNDFVHKYISGDSH